MKVGAALVLAGSLLGFPQEVPAGAWTLPRGHFWGKITWMRQSTREEYLSVGGRGRHPDPAVYYGPGERARYRFNGRYASRAVFFDLFYGLTDRLDVGTQVPYSHQEFVDDALRIGFGGPRVASGFSDVRGFLKFRLLQAPFVGSFQFGVKAPTGSFVNQEGLIPVGEGQWDFDFLFQAGRSFWPLPAYLNGEIGYRLRLKNREIDRDPGDEWTFRGEAGYAPLRGMMLLFKFEAVRSKATTFLGVVLPSSVRRIMYLTPALAFGPFAGVRLETALRFSAGGRGYPAGAMVLLGLSGTLPR